MREFVAEFPFVAELPKREKSKVAKLWDQLHEMAALVQEHGNLLPGGFVASLLNVSRQRVYELIQNETLTAFEFNGQKFVTERSIIEFCQTERKAGRPVKVPTTAGQVWKSSKQYVRGK